MTGHDTTAVPTGRRPGGLGCLVRFRTGSSLPSNVYPKQERGVDDVPEEIIVGPSQGTVDCVRILVFRGPVCQRNRHTQSITGVSHFVVSQETLREEGEGGGGSFRRPVLPTGTDDTGINRSLPRGTVHDDTDNPFTETPRTTLTPLERPGLGPCAKEETDTLGSRSKGLREREVSTRPRDFSPNRLSSGEPESSPD